MTDQIQDLQQNGKDRLETLFAGSSHFSEGFQQVLKETADYSRRYMESTSAFTKNLMGANSFESALQLQADFAKTQTEGLVAQMTKIAEIYKGMATQAFKPIESAVEKSKGFVQQH